MSSILMPKDPTSQDLTQISNHHLC